MALVKSTLDDMEVNINNSLKSTDSIENLYTLFNMKISPLLIPIMDSDQRRYCFRRNTKIQFNNETY